MKSAIVSGILSVVAFGAVGSSALALKVYDCEISFTAKSSSFLQGHFERKSVVLLAGQRSLISSEETLSSIDIAIGSDKRIHAFVPDDNTYQASEDVRAKIDGERFESKLSSIDVSCKPGADVAVAYVNRFNRKVTLKPDLGASVFVGNPGRAARDIRAALGKKTRIAHVGADRVTLTRNEWQCVEGHGQNVDEYQCDKDAMKDTNYTYRSLASLPASEKVCTQKKIVTGPPTHPDENHSSTTVCTTENVIATRGL